MISSQENVKKTGAVLIVSGPSGAGKSSICSAVMKDDGNIRFSVSCTTRKPRGAEEHGKDYYFMAKEEFQERILRNEFIEYAEVYGNYYGTLKSEVVEKIREGYDVLLDIDVQGAIQLKKLAMKDDFLAKRVELIFIVPPSYTILENRLRSRKTDSEEAVLKRLETSKNEIDFWREYDYVIINDDMQKAINDMKSVINSIHLKTKHLENINFNG